MMMLVIINDVALAEERTGSSGEKNYGSKRRPIIDRKSMDFCARPGWEVLTPPFTSFKLKHGY